MMNALTFDVEDYYQLVARNWLNIKQPVSQYVLSNTRTIIQFLRKQRVRATFFIVGAVAEKFPELIREIVDNGHEAGIHGNTHRSITEISESQFREEVEQNIYHIVNACGVKPISHRAPVFSLDIGNKAALEILAENGIRIDSSLFPFPGPRYGSGKIPRHPFVVFSNGKSEIWELVLPTLNVAGNRIPFGGGGYLRIFPYGLAKYGIKKVNSETLPATIYMHSYEVDCYHREALNTTDTGFSFYLKNLKQHIRRKSCKNKLERLINDFQFGTCREVRDRYLEEK